MGNPFVHVELTTGDLDRAKSFYTALFDWKLDDVPLGPSGSYTMIQVGEGTGGGMFTRQGAPTMWLPYVLVDDIDKATEKARSLGAQIIREALGGHRGRLALDLHRSERGHARHVAADAARSGLTPSALRTGLCGHEKGPGSLRGLRIAGRFAA